MSELWAVTLREELETGETGSMENQERVWAEQELGAWCPSGDGGGPGARGGPACTSGKQRHLEVSAQELKGQVPALQGIVGVVVGSPSPPSFCFFTFAFTYSSLFQEVPKNHGESTSSKVTCPSRDDFNCSGGSQVRIQRWVVRNVKSSSRRPTPPLPSLPGRVPLLCPL